MQAIQYRETTLEDFHHLARHHPPDEEAINRYYPRKTRMIIIDRYQSYKDDIMSYLLIYTQSQTRQKLDIRSQSSQTKWEFPKEVSIQYI